MTNRKRWLSVFLILVMVLSSAAQVFAAEGDHILFEEQFAGNAEKWQQLAGTGFSFQQNRLLYRPSAVFDGNPAILANVGGEFDNYELETDVIPGAGASFGIFVRMTDIYTHYLLRYDAGVFKLLKKVNGGMYTELASSRYNLVPGDTYRIHMTLNGADITVFIEEEQLMQVSDSSIRTGRVGFEGRAAAFDVASVSIIQKQDVVYESEPIVTVDPFETEKEAAIIYVSPDGNDSADGSEENPVRTFEKAKEMVKTLKAGRKPVTVMFRGGEYNIQNTINFDVSDAGSAGAPVIYQAYPGETPVFTGTKHLDVSKFQPVTDPAIVERLIPEARPYIRQMDLKEQGVDQETLDFTKDLRVGNSSTNLSFFLNGKKQSISRWPNVGYNTILDSTLGGQFRFSTGYLEGAVMSFAETNPLRWTQAKDLYVEGYFGSEYQAEWAKIKEVDTENLKLIFDTWTMYGVKKDYRWAAINLMEEIDIPGEWYVDKDAMILYYYPPYELDPAKDVFELGELENGFIRMNDCSYVKFDGLHFEKNSDDPSLETGKHGINNASTGGNGITVENSKHVRIENCKFANIGRVGLYINKCTDMLIDRNEFSHMGQNGIYVKDCGDRTTLTPPNITISNNRLYHASAGLNDMDAHAIRLYGGCGVIVEHNVMHGSNTAAINYTGNEHKIRYNEMYNLLRSMADAGVITVGRCWSEYGNVIEYNFVHNFGDETLGKMYSTNGVFMDDLHSGNIIRNNIIMPGAKLNTAGVKIGGGRDNTVTGNTVIDANNGIIGEDRTSNHEPGNIFNDAAYQSLTQVPYDKPPYSTRYPTMKEIYSDIEANGNVFVGIKNNMSNNLFVDVNGVSVSSVLIDTGTYENNVTTDDYSIFVDPEHKDYRVKNSAKAELGIADDVLDENFDINLIGIQDIQPIAQDPFNMLYPANGVQNLERQYAHLTWEPAEYADEYTYTVATDPEFTNIVAQDTILGTYVQLEDLNNSSTYYWKVTAHNISRQTPASWDSESGVYSFTTSEYDTLDKGNLQRRLDEANALLETMVEGDQPDQYREGSIAEFQAAIDEAQAVCDIQYGRQDEIDAAFTALTNRINTLDAFGNVGYGTLPDIKAEEWIGNNDFAKSYTIEDNTLIVNPGNNSATIGLDRKLSNREVLHFRAKTDNLDETWTGWSVRHLDISKYGYEKGAYMVVAKNDIFELQNDGIILTVPNNGIYTTGEWHDIEFGAITTERGVNIVFRVDGTTVFDYLDTQKPIYEVGSFALVPARNGNNYLQPSDDVPDGLFQISEAIQKEVAQEAEYFFTVEDEDYTEEGKWTDGPDGMNGGSSRTTAASGATARFHLTGEGTKYYKVYLWNRPSETSDKNVQIHFSNYGGEADLTLDLSQGEEGFIDLGTFRFITESAGFGELFVTFTGSGTGDLTLSGMKIQETTVDDPGTWTHRPNTQAQSGAADVLALKLDSPNALIGGTVTSVGAVAPFETNGRTLVPLRFIAEAFQCPVDWDDTSKTALVTAGDTVLQFPVGQNTYTYGEEVRETEQGAVLEGDTTMVPLRVIAEALSLQVHYDDTRRLVLIGSTVGADMTTAEKLDELNAKLQ